MKTRAIRISLFFCLLAMQLSVMSCKKDKEEEVVEVIDAPPVSTEPQQYETPFTDIPATSDLVVYERREYWVNVGRRTRMLIFGEQTILFLFR